LTRNKERIQNILFHLILMGILAGVPTIIGALVGGFSYSAVFGVFFLAIGAGAIFDVAYDILGQMAKDNWASIYTVTNVLGFLTGLLIMYATGFLVVG
jgi:zinc transporter ZupT